MPKLLHTLVFGLCAALAACTAPATNGGAAPQDPSAKAPPSMSRPLPANRVREAPVIDYGCEADSDCAVKNVGNCCGAMPACVNKDSPVDPAAVQSQCAKDGRAGVCGFREIESCSCNSGHCESTEAFMPQQSQSRPQPKVGL